MSLKTIIYKNAKYQAVASSRFYAMPAEVAAVAKEAIVHYIVGRLKKQKGMGRYNAYNANELDDVVTRMSNNIEVYRVNDGFSIYNNFVMTPVFGLFYNQLSNKWYQMFEGSSTEGVTPEKEITYDEALDLAAGLSDFPVTVKEINKYLAQDAALRTALEENEIIEIQNPYDI